MPKLDGLKFFEVHVRADTKWRFLEISDAIGTIGISEIANSDFRICQNLWTRLDGQIIHSDDDVVKLINSFQNEHVTSKNFTRAMSAIRSACIDLLARYNNVSVVEYLCGSFKQDQVEIYANINRSLLPHDTYIPTRLPKDFARAARSALNNGFKTIKCAPFDECEAPFASETFDKITNIGFQRVAAVRKEIGENINLYVDCHRRFNQNFAMIVEKALFDMNVIWFEEPCDPLTDEMGSKKIKEQSRILIAGGEQAYGSEAIRRIYAENICDVVMPDVCLCGGISEAYQAALFLENNISGSVSLHCPSGPVSLMGSAQVMAAIDATRPLEHAVNEIEWRSAITVPRERFFEGKLLISDSPGLGISLRHELCVQII